MGAKCTQCGWHPESTRIRPSGEYQCDPCWRAGLAHGHLHVDHDASVADCPLCIQERMEDRIIGSREGR